MYQLTNSTMVLRLSDGAFIPPDPANSDYQAYQQWLAAGNTPEPVPPKTPEELRAEAKTTRQAAVDAIKVTTQAGNTFDGDETSQARMSRAILVLSTGYAASVNWVLADNTVIQADVAELTEALALAGAAQAAIWVI